MVGTPVQIVSTEQSGSKEKGLSLSERLALISLIDQGMRFGSEGSPGLADLFSNLWDLVNSTVSGSKIDRLKPKDSHNGFHTFEIVAETGEDLGRLNMLYLKKPIPCYYLVYVEVSGPFRRKGLGNRILEYFRDFLIKKSAVGILDNIIPKDDPTYDIYFKQAWEPIENIIGDSALSEGGNYMVYVPPGLQGRPLREPLLKLIHHLKRRRATIEMRDNELMVQRTIAEFREIRSALLAYFQEELQRGEATPLMRFMFTRFVTKLIAFRRRIGELLGYTGGESIEQIVLPPHVLALSAETYTPGDLGERVSFVSGDERLWMGLPDALKKNPGSFFDSLPNYRRPSFVTWLKDRGMTANDPITIGDLLDLGFDPTRLKEMSLGEEEFIFERIQTRQLPELDKKNDLLDLVRVKMSGYRVGNAQLRINPPVLVLRHKGNAYVLRRKVEGIHWEEAVEQLQTSSMLRNLNTSMRIDRMIVGTVRRANEMIEEILGREGEYAQELLTCFVSWDLEHNRPKLVVDTGGTYLEAIWMA